MRRATQGAVFVAILLPTLLESQSPPSAGGGPAAAYLDRYHEVMQLGASAQSATVDHLVLTRDAGQVTFEHGMLYLLAPIGGRTVGAVFQGQGRLDRKSVV